MGIFQCVKCHNFCVISMNKDTSKPTFCPCNDGKYSGSKWINITKQTVEANVERVEYI